MTTTVRYQWREQFGDADWRDCCREQWIKLCGNSKIQTRVVGVTRMPNIHPQQIPKGEKP